MLTLGQWWLADKRWDFTVPGPHDVNYIYIYHIKELTNIFFKTEKSRPSMLVLLIRQVLNLHFPWLPGNKSEVN